jgi:putative ABC transport system ATP-binding protein
MAAALALEGVTVAFVARGRRCVALRAVSLEVQRGEFVGVYGRRQSGRSTLLHVVAGVVKPEEGRVLVDGLRVGGEWGQETKVGAVLVRPSACLTSAPVKEQVMTVLLAGSLSYRKARARSAQLLERTGVAALAAVRGSDLDREEAVRVAVAKALATEPSALLCDEPTLGLSFRATDRVLRLLREVAKDVGPAVVVTAGEVASIAGVDRALRLAQGRLCGETVSHAADVVGLPGAIADQSA